jgi:hypothetical protein
VKRSNAALQKANNSSREAQSEADSVVRKTDSRVQQAVQEMNRRATNMVRGFLMQNSICIVQEVIFYR